MKTRQKANTAGNFYQLHKNFSDSGKITKILKFHNDSGRTTHHVLPEGSSFPKALKEPSSLWKSSSLW